MTDHDAEFIVSGWVTGDSGRLTVIGRCGDTPIRIGDSFDLVYRNKPLSSPEAGGDEPVRLEERPISVRVVGIRAYEKDLRLLGQGMTGSMALEGEGSGRIAPGWILGRAPSANGTPYPAEVNHAPNA